MENEYRFICEGIQQDFNGIYPNEHEEILLDIEILDKLSLINLKKKKLKSKKWHIEPIVPLRIVEQELGKYFKKSPILH